ncbi:MAG: hypothetical protein AABZ28_03690, partial [Nitrospinota bacterium]
VQNYGSRYRISTKKKIDSRLSLGMRNDFYRMIENNKPETIFDVKKIFRTLIEHHKRQVPRL